MQRTSVTLLSIVLVLGVGVASAQPQGQNAAQAAEPTANAPIPAGAVVMIYRCEVKPGHSVAQQKAAAATSRAIAKAGGPNLLAMTALTGPSEVWFLVPYNSLTEVDKAYEAMAKTPAIVQAELDQLNDLEGAHYNTMRSVLALYREDMSLDASFNVSPYRAMSVTTYRVRPGRTREFAEGAKMVMGAYKKLNVGLRIAGFQVLGGAPSGTFIFMRPIKTASQLLPPDDVRKAYVEVLGGQEAMEKMEKALGDIIVSSEDAIFTFSPKMSNVPASYASADPFWRVTPAMAKTELKKAVEPVKK
jgi:hypothetical protein